MTGNRRYSKKKLKNLVLYILGHKKFKHGNVIDDFFKLSNMLYMSDMENFKETGKSITGATYIRVTQGAIPKQLPDLFDEMIVEGSIKITPTRKKSKNVGR